MCIDDTPCKKKEELAMDGTCKNKEVEENIGFVILGSVGVILGGAGAVFLTKTAFVAA